MGYKFIIIFTNIIIIFIIITLILLIYYYSIFEHLFLKNEIDSIINLVSGHI